MGKHQADGEAGELWIKDVSSQRKTPAVAQILMSSFINEIFQTPF